MPHNMLLLDISKIMPIGDASTICESLLKMTRLPEVSTLPEHEQLEGRFLDWNDKT